MTYPTLEHFWRAIITDALMRGITDEWRDQAKNLLSQQSDDFHDRLYSLKFRLTLDPEGPRTESAINEVWLSLSSTSAMADGSEVAWLYPTEGALTVAQNVNPPAVDLCEVARELERVHVADVIRQVAAIANERTAPYWAGFTLACEEFAGRLNLDIPGLGDGAAMFPIEGGWPQTVVVASGDMCFTADWNGEHFVTRSPIALAATPSEEPAQGEAETELTDQDVYCLVGHAQIQQPEMRAAILGIAHKIAHTIGDSFLQNRLALMAAEAIDASRTAAAASKEGGK